MSNTGLPSLPWERDLRLPWQRGRWRAECAGYLLVVSMSAVRRGAGTEVRIHAVRPEGNRVVFRKNLGVVNDTDAKIIVEAELAGILATDPGVGLLLERRGIA